MRSQMRSQMRFQLRCQSRFQLRCQSRFLLRFQSIFLLRFQLRFENRDTRFLLRIASGNERLTSKCETDKMKFFELPVLEKVAKFQIFAEKRRRGIRGFANFFKFPHWQSAEKSGNSEIRRFGNSIFPFFFFPEKVFVRKSWKMSSKGGAFELSGTVHFQRARGQFPRGS